MTETPSRGASLLLSDDVVSGAVLLLIAVGYGAGALRIPGQPGEPGPGFLPLALAVLLAALSLAILVSGATRGASNAAAAADAMRSPAPAGPRSAADDERSGSGTRAQAAGPYLATLATIAYAALFQPLGFVLSTLGYSGYVTSLFTEDRKLRLSVPVLVTLSLFVFFRLALGVRLPPGLFR